MSSTAQSSKATGHQPQARPKGPERTTIHHREVAHGYGEDANDPISEVDEVFPEGSQRSSLQEVIPSPTGYKGTAYRGPPRENQSGRLSKPSEVTRNQTSYTSRHFPPAQKEKKRRRSSAASSVVEVGQTNAVSRTTRQQNEPLTGRNNAPASLKPSRDSDGSMDELAMGYKSPNQKTARQLLARRKQLDGSSAQAKTTQEPEVDVDTSEDELKAEGTNKKADIISTEFRKKRKPEQVKGEDRYTLVQIFTPRCKYLVGGYDKPWVLVRDQTSGVLTVRDHGGSLVQDLEIMPSNVLKFIRGEGTAKIHLRKSADNTLQGSPSICLELGDAEQCANLHEKMQKQTPTISLIPKAG